VIALNTSAGELVNSLCARSRIHAWTGCTLVNINPTVLLVRHILEAGHTGTYMSIDGYIVSKCAGFRACSAIQARPRSTFINIHLAVVSVQAIRTKAHI
jgi:hypothetical protein